MQTYHNLTSSNVGNRLPPYKQIGSFDFCWRSQSRHNFKQMVDRAYSEVVHWKRNLFKLLYGAVGRQSVSEMASLFEGYADASNLESIAITSTMIMPHLLLQKPDGKLNVQKKSQCLSRRLSAI